MNSRRNSRFTSTLAAGSMLAASASLRADVGASHVEDAWFRAWPPASVTYSLPAQVRQGGTRLGELDTVEFHAAFIQSVQQTDRLNWLLGADWQRIQSSVPSGAPLPNTLQSAAAVVGFDWFFRDRWRARLEVLPGVYSDFQDMSGDDFNAPFNVEVSYAFGTNLLVGGQLSVNARRESPVLGAVGVRWKFADDWLLSLWFPRPRIEYFATDDWTLFAGGQFVGGTFVVADDFGHTHGQPNLDGQAVDFQEIRLGGGVRHTIKQKLAVEISGGWTVDRRYDFHGRNPEFQTDTAPYVQIGLGLKF
jgi:hypothetical protein